MSHCGMASLIYTFTFCYVLASLSECGRVSHFPCATTLAAKPPPGPPDLCEIWPHSHATTVKATWMVHPPMMISVPQMFVMVKFIFLCLHSSGLSFMAPSLTLASSSLQVRFVAESSAARDSPFPKFQLKSWMQLFGLCLFPSQ